jgi:hypothetical protein
VTAGTQAQIQKVIDQNLIPSILHVLKTAEFKAQKEAVWAITNLTSGGTIEQIATVANQGIVPILCDLLTVKDSKVRKIFSRGFSSFLSSAQFWGKMWSCDHRF